MEQLVCNKLKNGVVKSEEKVKKLVGYMGKVPVYEDPDCPSGKMYFLNKSYQEYTTDAWSIYGIKLNWHYKVKGWLTNKILHLFKRAKS